MLCSGAAWRDLPERFGPWQTVHDRYRRWSRDGTIDRILESLQLQLLDDGTLDLETWFVDSTTVRAQRAAAGAKKAGTEARTNAAEQALGRSRGGFTTKVHLLCDGRGVPLSVHLSAGQCHDSPQLAPSFEAVTVPVRLKVLVADRGYDSAAIRSQLSGQGIAPVIPKRRSKAVPEPEPACPVRYRHRNIIERLIGHWNRLASRYEKLARHYLTMVKLACIRRIFKLHFSDTA